jgi:hypothetical protein
MGEPLVINIYPPEFVTKNMSREEILLRLRTVRHRMKQEYPGREIIMNVNMNKDDRLPVDAITTATLARLAQARITAAQVEKLRATSRGWAASREALAKRRSNV